MNCLKLKIHRYSIPIMGIDYVKMWAIQLYVNDNHERTLYVYDFEMKEIKKILKNKSLLFLHLREEGQVGIFSRFLLKHYHNVNLQVEYLNKPHKVNLKNWLTQWDV